MKIAYFSPLSPVRSGIADYSEELLPFLGQHAEINLFVDGYLPTNPSIVDRFSVLDSHDFPSPIHTGSYDAVLYHIGNSSSHTDAYWTLAQVPGVTVLHDYVLHHAVVEMTVARGDPFRYVREMGFSHGVAGATAAREALLRSHEFPYLALPLNRRAIEASLGLIVHSEYVRSLVLASAPEKPVSVIPLHAAPPSFRWHAADARKALGLDPRSVVFASFGLASVEKRLHVALRAFRRVVDRLPNARYVIVGEIPRSNDVPSLISALKLERSVDCSGYVGLDTYLTWVAAADIGVNLRGPTMGESSASFVRLLAAGTPTIVSAIGSFAEFPDDVCRKVPLDESEEEVLATTMLELALDREGRQALGQRARAYVAEHHAVERCAEKYMEFIQFCCGVTPTA